MNTKSTYLPTRLAVLGATGSIGSQTLDIVAAHPELYSVSVLTTNRRIAEAAEAARKVKPALVVVTDPSRYAEMRAALADMPRIEVACGAEAMAEAVTRDDVDMVVTATVGYSGLLPTIAAIKAGKDIALANKETLVVAGDLIRRLLVDYPVNIYPVDSEHSAIAQCLHGEDPAVVNRLIITASGGPFRTWTLEQMRRATAADALRHPNWDMGAKITIDSATMMNKAFEIIEARHLFNIEPARISAVVHPQSIVHSMVEFTDGAIKAQLGVPDMHLPIAYALGRGHRLPEVSQRLSLADMATLTFEQPDAERFPCLKFAHYALQTGGNSACVINAANEVAVDAFLHGRIGFCDFAPLINDTLGRVAFIANPSLADLVVTNTEARAVAASLIKN